jgi:hypothetical protein
MEQAFDNEFRAQAAHLSQTAVPKPSPYPVLGNPTSGEQARLPDGRFTYKQTGEIRVDPGDLGEG